MIFSVTIANNKSHMKLINIGNHLNVLYNSLWYCIKQNQFPLTISRIILTMVVNNWFFLNNQPEPNILPNFQNEKNKKKGLNSRTYKSNVLCWNLIAWSWSFCLIICGWKWRGLAKFQYTCSFINKVELQNRLSIQICIAWETPKR